MSTLAQASSATNAITVLKNDICALRGNHLIEIKKERQDVLSTTGNFTLNWCLTNFIFEINTTTLIYNLYNQLNLIHV